MRLRLFPLLAVVASAGLTAAPSVAAAGSPDGSSLFRQRCMSCHSVEADRRNSTGPNLAGVVGRKAAASDFRYSPALRQSNITWTRAKLEAFLAGPSAMVPGTRMVVSVSNAIQRKAIIDFLARSKG